MQAAHGGEAIATGMWGSWSHYLHSHNREANASVLFALFLFIQSSLLAHGIVPLTLAWVFLCQVTSLEHLHKDPRHMFPWLILILPSWCWVLSITTMERIYFGSWFQRFQTITLGSIALGFCLVRWRERGDGIIFPLQCLRSVGKHEEGPGRR